MEALVNAAACPTSMREIAMKMMTDVLEFGQFVLILFVFVFTMTLILMCLDICRDAVQNIFQERVSFNRQRLRYLLDEYSRRIEDEYDDVHDPDVYWAHLRLRMNDRFYSPGG